MLSLPSAPVVVAPTPMPFREDDAVDHGRLADLVDRQATTALTGFVVGSGGGEERFLSDAERIEAVRTVAQANGGRKLVIGGIDCPSTTETLRLAESMAAAGADMVRIRIPQNENGGNTGTAVPYFAAVTERCPVPVIVIHQTFQTGGFAATPEEIGEICSLERIRAYIFWHNIRYESYASRFVPGDVPLWTPNGSLLAPGALIGATGACCFFANWGPDLVARVLDLGIAGRFSEAQELQRTLLRADFLGMLHGVAALKAGLEILGYGPMAPRRPTRPLGAAEVAALREALLEAGLSA